MNFIVFFLSQYLSFKLTNIILIDTKNTQLYSCCKNTLINLFFISYFIIPGYYLDKFENKI